MEDSTSSFHLVEQRASWRARNPLKLALVTFVVGAGLASAVVLSVPTFSQADGPGLKMAQGDQHTVRFEVDMGCADYQMLSTDRVHVQGVQTHWQSAAATLDDKDGDGVYTGSLTAPSGVYEFKMSVGHWVSEKSYWNAWWEQEDLTSQANPSNTLPNARPCAWTKLGEGVPTDIDGAQLPQLFRAGATLEECRQQCDQLQECAGVAWGGGTGSRQNCGMHMTQTSSTLQEACPEGGKYRSFGDQEWPGPYSVQTYFTASGDDHASTPLTQAKVPSCSDPNGAGVCQVYEAWVCVPEVASCANATVERGGVWANRALRVSSDMTLQLSYGQCFDCHQTTRTTVSSTSSTSVSTTTEVVVDTPIVRVPDSSTGTTLQRVPVGSREETALRLMIENPEQGKYPGVSDFNFDRQSGLKAGQQKHSGDIETKKLKFLGGWRVANTANAVAYEARKKRMQAAAAPTNTLSDKETPYLMTMLQGATTTSLDALPAAGGLDASLNEVLMLHGGNAHSMRRYQLKNRMMGFGNDNILGKGIYFAGNVVKNDQYCGAPSDVDNWSQPRYTDDLHTLLGVHQGPDQPQHVCYVVLARTLMGNFVRKSTADKEWQGQYDSAFYVKNGMEREPWRYFEYVVADDDAVDMEYVIAYWRQNEHDL